MGTYVCEANNGITPKAYQEFNVQVNCKQNSCLGIFADLLIIILYTFILVPPLIRVHRGVVGGYNGSFAILQVSCCKQCSKT